MMARSLILMLVIILPGVHGQDNYNQEPFIRDHPENTEVSKGDTIRLKCYVYGLPIPEVTWYKDGGVINENITEGRIFENDKSLVIRKARRSSKHDDTGVYYCVARNVVGVQYSKNATVTVRYLAKNFRLAPQNVTANLLTNPIMRCVPPSGFPPAVVEWRHNNAKLVVPDNIVKIVKVGSESQIQFTGVTWRYRGQYTCVAINSEGRRFETAYLTLKVLKPDLYAPRNLIEKHVGSSFELEIGNNFEPEPSFTWSKVDGEMPELSRMKYAYKNSILAISDAKFSDDGKYKCVAKNDAGESSLIFTVKIYEKPSFDVLPVNVEVGQGQTARFDCSVKGGKNSRVGWFFNHEYFNQQNAGTDLYVDSSNSLILSNVDATKQKSIRCVFNDDIDRVRTYSNYAKLRVIATPNPPPRVHVLPSVVLYENSNQMLPCTVSGLDPKKPAVAIKWETTKDNKPVDLGATGVWITKGKNSANLTINNLLTSDNGGYRCLVNSSSGTASNFTILTVKPLAAEIPPKVTDLNYIDLRTTSVTLAWIRPKTTVLAPILSYFIKITDTRTEKVSGTDTRYTVTGLFPDTVYTFTIYAINKVGNGDISRFPTIETPEVIGTTDKDKDTDKLENVNLKITIGAVTSSIIEVRWNPVDAQRITGYIVKYKESIKTNFIDSSIITNTKTSITLHSLKSSTDYTVKMVAIGHGSRQSKDSNVEVVKTHQALILSPQNVYIEKVASSAMMVGWEIPDASKASIDTIEILVYYSIPNTLIPRKLYRRVPVQEKSSKLTVVSGLDGSKTYYISVALTTKSGQVKKSKEVDVLDWAKLKNYERLPKEAPVQPPSKEKEDDKFSNIVKEPWFIATIGVFVWLILLVIVVIICCRKRKKNRFRGSSSVYESRGLLPGHDYPNTSLNRPRLHDQHTDHYSLVGKKKSRKCCSCCRAASESSLEEDFPNRVHIKPNGPPHESFEMHPKPDGYGMMKPNNVGVVMRNGNHGYMVGAPLNNERNYRQNSIENRQYNGQPDRMKMMGAPPMRRDAPAPPGSGSMSRRYQEPPDYKMDSVERRLGEIVRTNKQAEADVNMMGNNPQASWKRDKPKNSPTLSPKPPGENTLRRQGKTQFKPLPKLEVLNWADGLPNVSSNTEEASPPGSPKTSSAYSEIDNARTDSRMSHGESNNSLNKYSGRRRRNSNASSMMSSELYQSEMDPSGYSDIGVEKKRKKKEKAIPPPIHFDGITSDILLQWAESVTNSSPSSSGSSSPSRLSGISSEGSLYTDEDFAQAVAAVAECGGFNVDYDYSLPGMNSTPVPLSSTRNSKMNKIDQVLAQRQKNRNTPSVPGSKTGGLQTPQSFIPQISMSSYLTGSSKGPQSTTSGSSGLPRPTRVKDKSNPASRYGTGFDDVDSVSSSNSRPLTVSNLMKHDSSLDRAKKESTQPLTVSNLRQHDSSLDRERRTKQKQPIAYEKPPPYDAPVHKTAGVYNRDRDRELLPEAPSLVTSALDRHESMNSNSKDSVNSSNRHDSEVENNSGTSERKQQRKGKKYYVNNRDPKSSTSTVSTVRTTPEHDDVDDDDIDDDADY